MVQFILIFISQLNGMSKQMLFDSNLVQFPPKTCLIAKVSIISLMKQEKTKINFASRNTNLKKQTHNTAKRKQTIDKIL